MREVGSNHGVGMPVVLGTDEKGGSPEEGFGWVRLCITAALFVAAYVPTFTGLIRDWWLYPWNSHGFIIVFVSAGLLWQRRREIRSSLSEPDSAGFLPLLGGILLLVAGLRGDEELPARISLPVTALGLAVFFFGKGVIKPLLFPLSYLLFMIPIPYTMNKGVAMPLQLLDARLAASWLSWLGVPVFREGVLLHLPNTTLEVADLCSGVQSLIALTPLGLIYIYHLRARWKSFLYASIIPVSILANVIRIVLTAVMVYHFGNWVLSGALHTLSGGFNFLLAFSIIMLLGKLAEKASQHGS
ncbi:MAG: exosortase/archaeosortase family protein [Acidobacteriota bacterium]